MNEKNVPLESLVGSHCLSGVDRLSEPNDDRYEPIRQVFRFTLDGITYVATEDPDDGYRSSMRTFAVSAAPTKNTFPPVAVTGRMKPDTQYESNHTLQLVDDVTGEVVLEVGTDNVGDYYPGFVAEWRPELLAPNAGK
jgi:hypothetical protein